MSGSHTAPKNLDNKLKLGIVLNTGFTIIEFVAGILSGSLALVSDAGHNLTDSTSLVISFFAQKIAKRDANVEHTYGYGRATILAALVNGLILLFLAFYIFYEAYQRFFNPEPVNGLVVTGVALVGFIINLSIASLFKNESHDLNIKSVYLNMLFDALASLGAVIAGILIIFTKLTIFDPLISVLIGFMLIKSSWGLVREAIHVLLEGVPTGINTEDVKQQIKSVSPLIKNIDDLHIWLISSQQSALSCHIVIEECDMEKSMKIVSQIKEKLHHEFKIEHATIETELVECLPEKGEM